MEFTPDYRYMLDVLRNRKPRRLPVYEHIISPKIMEQVLGVSFAELQHGAQAEMREFFMQFCRFWKVMTYDTVSFEVCITEILPDHGALMGGRPGPIQNRQDFERYPWADLPRMYWELAEPQFAMLGACLLPGMRALGGVGNGVFEISEDLVGYEYLCYMMADDPELLADIYRKIGDLMVELWREFLFRHAEIYAICRFGDDLGFKTSTLVAPRTIRQHIIPQYRRVVEAVHSARRPLLWHSCGSIFTVMDDVIAIGIDAKHSNEDVIAPFDTWIARYGDRIGLLGGIDVDTLCQKSPEQITADVFEKGGRYRSQAHGYALGSGNSIPDYVPIEGYLAMIQAAQCIRAQEAA